MDETALHNARAAGDAYEAYMGRWSRKLAPQFIDFLGAAPGGDWLDIGCGTGALSAAIAEHAAPVSVLGIDLSEDFVAKARSSAGDPRLRFETGNAEALPLEAQSRDAVVSSLALNLVPDIPRALAEMQRVARPGGRIGFTVWDYPGGGLGFVDRFWKAASRLDPWSEALDEARRFEGCTAEALAGLAEVAGLGGIETRALEIETAFDSFDDYWTPFTLGSGPAPGYAASQPAEALAELKAALEAELAPKGGPFVLPARAWALRALA